MTFSKHSLALAVMAASVSLAQAPAVLADAGSESTPEKDYQPTLLNQVTVTATRSEKQLKDVAGSVAVIDDEQMEKELANDIKDAVRYEPGVSVGTDGYRGGNEGFNIRGMQGNRVKIMVDGVDQAQQFTVGPSEYIRSQRNFVDMETLKAIEVVKGPSSTLYGSDAIGGLVAFKTKDPSDLLKPAGDDTSASIKAGYSSVNEGFSETFSLANRSGDLETMLIYTRRDHKETDTHSGSDIYGSGRGQGNPSDTGLNNVLAKAQYQVNENNRIGLTGEFMESKTDSELKTMSPDGVTGKDQVERQRIGISHEWDAGLAGFDSMEWQLDWQNSETNMKTHRPAYTFPGMPPFPNRNFDYLYSESGLQLNAQFNKALSWGEYDHTIVYGFNGSQTKVDNTSTEHNLDNGTSTAKNYIPKTDATKYGVYFQDEIQLTSRWTVSPGIRYDKYEYNPEGNTNLGEPAEDSQGDKLTARLGTVYQFNENLSAFAQFSQGFKAPGLMEIYYTYDQGEVQLANPNLKPEESNSFELGLRGDGRLGSYEVTSFYNKYSNFIDLQVIGVDNSTGSARNIKQYRNVAKAEIKGVEFRGQLWLDEAIKAPAGTTLRGSVAYADGENKENGEKLNSVAPLTGVVGLGYDDLSGRYGGEFAWTLVKGKSDSDVSNSEVDSGEQFNPAGYGIVDLTAYYVPVKDVTLRAGLFNITDKKYWILEDVRGRESTYAGLDRYAQPGRNVSVSVKWDI